MASISPKRFLAAAVAMIVLGLTLALFRFVGEAEAFPQRRSLAEFPSRLGEWRCPRRILMREGIARIAQVDDYLLCNYVRVTQSSATEYVNVYVGYHARQVREGGTGRYEGETAIHPPKHCLPGSGWDIIDAGLEEIEVAGLPLSPAPVNRFTIAKGNQRQLVYYWYQSRGRVIARDWKKVAYLALDRVLRQRTDGALVRFTTPIEGEDIASADERIHSVIAGVVPRLPDFLPE